MNKSNDVDAAPVQPIVMASVPELTLPKPYYQDGSVTIYHGDSLQISRLIAGVGAVVSDPPYGMAWHCNLTSMAGRKQKDGTTSGGRNWGTKIKGDDVPFDPTPWLSFKHVCLFGCNHFGERLPKGTTLIWIKRNDEAFGNFFSDAELAWMKGGCGVYCRRDFSFNSEAKKGERVHPTQKPVSVMRWCLSFIPEQEMVLDPFMGSGSTLVAAKLEGRKAIGIEIEEKYCEVAAKRLAQGVLF